MHKFFTKNIYIPIICFISKESFFNDLDFLLKTDRYKKEEIEKIKLKRLKEIISHSYENTVYYKKVFDKLSIKPEDIKNVSDLKKLPILTKSDVYDNNKYLISKKFSGKLVSGSTSGSTGDALKFCYNSYAVSKIEASQARQRFWFGVDVGDKMFACWGRPIISKKDRFKTSIKNFLRNYMVISAFDLSGENILKYMKKAERFNPKLIYGYSSSLYEIANFIKENNIKLNIKPNVLIYTADMMFENMKKVVEEIFNCPAKSEYGCSEIGCFAFECERGNLHIAEENVVVEIVKDGEVVDYGVEGEVVVTSLINFAMPFIRYNVGDLGMLMQNKCDCGREHQVMKISGAKVVDMLFTKEGKVSSGRLFRYILIELLNKGYYGIKQFKVIQEEIDKFTVLIVKGNNFSDFYLKFWEDKMKEHLGDDIVVNFKFVEKIEKEKTGKLKFFESRVREQKEQINL